MQTEIIEENRDKKDYMYKNRISKLRGSFDKEKIDAFLVSSALNIHYLTGYSNFSKDEREAYLFITESTATLFTDSRYIEAVEKIIPSNVKATIEKPLKTLGQIVKDLKINRIGFETNFTVYELEKFKKEISSKFVLSDDLVEKLREIKDVDEIRALKKAAALTDITYSHVLENIRMKINVTEKELAWRMEKFIKENGGTLAFDSIVAFGANSSIPHHITSSKKLSVKDEFILLDFGAKIDEYCSDMTRTLLTKSSSTRAKKVYQAVLDAQKKAADSIIVNKKGNAANAAKIANAVLVSKGFKPVPHGLGHGIGLEVHEKPHLHPKFDDILVNGMVFSIEPGIYIPGFGGVRIEDDYLLNNNEIKQITTSLK